MDGMRRVQLFGVMYATQNDVTTLLFDNADYANETDDADDNDEDSEYDFDEDIINIFDAWKFSAMFISYNEFHYDMM